MMKRKIYILTLALAAICVGGRVAGQEALQEPWTLNDCITWALQNNIQLHKTRLSEDEAELNRKQTRLNFIPGLNAGISSTTTFGRTLDPVTNDFYNNSTNMGASISLSTDLFAGLNKHYQAQRADLSLKSTLFGIEKAANDLILNVTAAFLEVLFAEEQLLIAQRQIETLEIQAEHTYRMVEAGKNTVGDQLQIDAQLAEAESEAVTARNNVAIKYLNLCQLLEIRDHRSFKVAQSFDKFDISRPVPSGSEVMEQAQYLPEMQAAKVGVQIAEKDIQIAKSALYPTLSLSAGYGTSYSDRYSVATVDPTQPDGYSYAKIPFGEQIEDNASGSFGLTLSIPIFNSMRAKNDVTVKRIALQRADYDKMLAYKEINKEVEQAIIDSEGTLEQYRASMKNVAMSEEDFRMVQKRFEIGAATPVDFNIALTNLVKAQSRLSQAKYQYIFQMKILDFYRGVPISL